MYQSRILTFVVLGNRHSRKWFQIRPIELLIIRSEVLSIGSFEQKFTDSAREIDIEQGEFKSNQFVLLRCLRWVAECFQQVSSDVVKLGWSGRSRWVFRRPIFDDHKMKIRFRFFSLFVFSILLLLYFSSCVFYSFHFL